MKEIRLELEVGKASLPVILQPHENGTFGEVLPISGVQLEVRLDPDLMLKYNIEAVVVNGHTYVREDTK